MEIKVDPPPEISLFSLHFVINYLYISNLYIRSLRTEMISRSVGCFPERVRLKTECIPSPLTYSPLALSHILFYELAIHNVMTEGDECTISPLEVRRKVFHILLGCHFFVLLTFMFQLRWAYLALLALGLTLSFLQEKRPLPAITWILGRFDRPHEAVPGRGIITYFSGAMLVCFIFPEEIALTAILVLAFGDPFAYLVGCSLGRVKLPWNPNKTLEGMLGFLGASSLFTMIYIGGFQIIFPCFLASLVETFNLSRWRVLDDNITVALTFGTVMYLISLL